MIKISYREAKPGMKLAKPVWHPFSYNILLNAGTILNAIYIKRLHQFQVENLFILEGNFTYKDEDFPEIPLIKHIPNGLEKQVYMETYQGFKSIFEDSKEGKTINLAPVAQTVGTLVEQILKDQHILIQLSLVKSHDNYTVTHCINVAIFSTILGSFLGWPNEDITELGIGALLHDIGKARIPHSILNKTEGLTYHEFEVMKHHPLFGYEELQDKKVSEMVREIVRDHHERCDGSGYPLGRKEAEISVGAKIVAIADIYDALTTDRVYREAIVPHEAVEMLLTSVSRGHLNSQLVKLFLKNIAIYPMGSTVELTNGMSGKVIEIPTDMPMRPTIKLDKPMAGVDTVALLNHPTIFIKRIVS